MRHRTHDQHPNSNIKKRMRKKCDQIERDTHTHTHTTMHYIAQYCINLVANVKTLFFICYFYFQRLRVMTFFERKTNYYISSHYGYVRTFAS